MVLHRGKWYATSGATATGVFEGGTAYNTFAEAIAATTVATTAITSCLIANEIYDVYTVFAPTATTTIGNGKSLDNNDMNTIVDVSYIQNGQQNTALTIFASAANGATLYLYGLTALTQANTNTVFANTTLNGSTGITCSDYAATLTYRNAANSTYITVTGNGTGSVVIKKA